MKKLLLIFIAFPILLSGQESSGFVLKTLMLQDIFYKNPNLIIEKPIKSNNSIELLVALRNSDWFHTGGEGPPIPHMYDCTGFTLGISFRHYFPKSKSVPNTWFVSGLIRYNDTYIKDLDMSGGIHSISRTVNLHRNGPELGIVFGRQFLILKHFTTEIYLGTGAYIQYYNEEFISGIEAETLSNEMSFKFRPSIGWTVGYFFNKMK